MNKGLIVLRNGKRVFSTIMYIDREGERERSDRKRGLALLLLVPLVFSVP
jgi:hypothetical protein